MGTRNLTVVKKGGEVKVAQYGQWDGYPEGQGMTIIEFLRNKKRIKKLTKALDRVRFLDNIKDKEFIDGYNSRCNLEGKDKRTDEEKRWFETYESRDLGGKILYNIIDSKDKEILLSNGYDFGKESLFCEWAYLIDLDDNTLEVFCGFNKDKDAQDKRFYTEEGLDYNKEYYGVELVKTYSLDLLPTKKQLLKDFYKK